MRPLAPSHQTPYRQADVPPRQPDALRAGHEPRRQEPSGQRPLHVGDAMHRPRGDLAPSGPGVMTLSAGGERVNAALTWSLGLDQSTSAVVMERSPRRAARWAPGAAQPAQPAQVSQASRAAGHG